MMEQLKKPSIISGKTVIMSIRIIFIIFAKVQIFKDKPVFCLKQSKKYGYKGKIEELRAELHRHNYNYYVLNAPEISDKEFDDKMRELQDLELAHPEYKDEIRPLCVSAVTLTRISRRLHINTPCCLWQIRTLKAKLQIL